mmetsp:Transcript_25173/g.49194  ORF Transcript_25173/g.49194 Transcript_25173/m.49194 type:complete len:100 (-) Transcript_25173:193-492(-)
MHSCGKGKNLHAVSAARGREEGRKGMNGERSNERGLMRGRWSDAAGGKRKKNGRAWLRDSPHASFCQLEVEFSKMSFTAYTQPSSHSISLFPSADRSTI